MAMIDKDAFVAAVNSDPEFSVAGRFFNGSMKLEMGDDPVLIKFLDGKISNLGEANTFDAADVAIKGSAEDWHEFLQPIPKPFYHDMFAAVVREGFEWSGDVVTLFAYYGAFRRMFDVMRQNATL
mgnify:CR=1 FL=1|jgi:hypothetical protein